MLDVRVSLDYSEVDLKPQGEHFLHGPVAACRSGPASSESRVAVIAGDPEQTVQIPVHASDIFVQVTRSGGGAGQTVGVKSVLGFKVSQADRQLQRAPAAMMQRIEGSLRRGTSEALLFAGQDVV